MPSLRIRGQETQIVLTRGGVLETTFDNIHSLNVELESEILEASYLGMKTKLHDDIFHGVKGDFEWHSHSQDWLRWALALMDRQKRNTPALVFNITTVLFYPNFDNPQIFIPDVKFGPLGVGFPNREAYVNKKISYAADDWDVQLS
jgi:hypothetical protein